MCYKKVLIFKMLFISIMLLSPVLTFAYDLNEKLTIEGMLTGVYQYAHTDIDEIGSLGRGTAALDLGINFHPTKTDEFQVSLSYATGNGLNYLCLFSLLPYAANLEDDLKNINGRNRDYLLEAWYKHTFQFSETSSLAIAGGIIDATAYIDDNAFANDEKSQFMNEIFVNHKNVNLPSYDIGGAAEFNISNFTLRAVVMNTKYEDSDDEFKKYNYYALQIAYALDTSIGKGNYRIYGYTTSKKFQSWDESGDERLQGIGISADQELSEIIGVFARIGWQDDVSVIDHDNIYSGGFNINGKLWGRENDVIGLGYAYLNGTNKCDLDYTNVLETYAKFQITKFSDITLDIQYIADDLRHDDDRNSWIYGIRANAYF